MNARRLLPGIIGLATCFNVAAYQYSLEDGKFDIAITDKLVSVQFCKETCDTSSAEKSTLISLLKDRVSEYAKILDDETALSSIVKKQIDDPNTLRFPDTSSGSQYIMLSIGTGFNLPVVELLMKDGDYTIAANALSSTKERYMRAISILESGKLPLVTEVISTSDSEDIRSLQNIVKYKTNI